VPSWVRIVVPKICFRLGRPRFPTPVFRSDHSGRERWRRRGALRAPAWFFACGEESAPLALRHISGVRPLGICSRRGARACRLLEELIHERLAAPGAQQRGPPSAAPGQGEPAPLPLKHIRSTHGIRASLIGCISTSIAASLEFPAVLHDSSPLCSEPRRDLARDSPPSRQRILSVGIQLDEARACPALASPRGRTGSRKMRLSPVARKMPGFGLRSGLPRSRRGCLHWKAWAVQCRSDCFARFAPSRRMVLFR